MSRRTRGPRRHSRPPLSWFEKLEERHLLAFDIQLQFGANVTPQARAGFEAGAAVWESLLGDDITVRIAVDMVEFLREPGGPPVPNASSDATKQVVWYSDVREALLRDATSDDDRLATSWLQGGSRVAADAVPGLGPTNNFGLPVLARRVWINSDQRGQMVLDADGSYNNTQLWVPTANLKALGLVQDVFGRPIDNPGELDGVLEMNVAAQWSYDPHNLNDCLAGPNFGCMDFVGTVAHEMGHILGFVSGVDTADIAPEASRELLQGLGYFSVLDLYRYTQYGIDPFYTGARSFYGHQDGGFGAERETTDGSLRFDTAYFSLDGGLTNLASFSTGLIHGSPRNQAGHWEDRGAGDSIGLMDPKVARRERQVPLEVDVRAFDAIGYDLAPARFELDRALAQDLESAGGNLPQLVLQGWVPETEVIQLSPGGGQLPADRQDFTLANTLTVPAGYYDGSPVSTISIPLTITKDNTVEANQEVVFSVNSLSPKVRPGDVNGNGTTWTAHRYTILNDDYAAIEFSSAAGRDLEGAQQNVPKLLVKGELEISQRVVVGFRGPRPGPGQDPVVVTLPVDILPGRYDGTPQTAVPIPLNIPDNAEVGLDLQLDLLISATDFGLIVGDADGDGRTVTEHAYTIVNDDPGIAQIDGTLLIAGSPGPDVVSLQITPRRVRAETRMAGGGSTVQTFDPATLERVLVVLGGGHDRATATAAGSVKLPVFIDGGEGDDVLTSLGISSVLWGGAGNDLLTAWGNQRSILIGGTGRDLVSGAGGESLLIGGSTAYDLPSPAARLSALEAVLQEWNSSRSYEQRVANIRAGQGPILADKQVYLRDQATVFDDGEHDDLLGLGGRHWYFGSLVEDHLWGWNRKREARN